MDTKFRRIGQGFCGTVWAAPTETEHSYAHKREDGGPGRSLHNDYVMHQRVLETLSHHQPEVAIPRCHQFFNNDDQTWWDSQISKFPDDYQIRFNILITDRIPPFSKTVRENIIDRYYPESLRSSVKSSKPDEDCLIRPYLKRRRRLEKRSRFQAFSLRNYPLHTDQIEEMGLDGILYAKIIARTLADLYWRAHIGANDLEFVLAPAKVGCNTQLADEVHHPTVIPSHILGDHSIWILDFDCCRQMPINGSGVEQAAKAFLRNDPFYPRPGCQDAKDRILWKPFKQRFLEASEGILGQGSPEAHLPALWVDTVEKESRLVKNDNLSVS